MEGTRMWKKASFSKILWIILAILLYVPSYGLSAVYDVPLNTTHNVGTGPDMDIEQILSADWSWVNVYGTLNTYDGAYIEPDIYVKSDGEVNVYAGTFGAVCRIRPVTVGSVTVYGTDFEVTTGTIVNGSWTPGGYPGGTLTGYYGNGDPINIQFISDVAIILAPPSGQENNPPVADAGSEKTVFTKDIASTVIVGTATDPDVGDSLQYRWLEGIVKFTLLAPVSTNGEAPLNLGTIDPLYLDVGTHTLTLEVSDGTVTTSDDMVLTIEIAPITIDIKPGSYPNSINLGSNGVVPVAILSTADFDAADPDLVNPDNVFLAGSGVRVRGKSNKYLAHEEDVNSDGLMDLVVQVETEYLDAGQIAEGVAYLTINETNDPDSIVYYRGWDEITIVPPEG